MARAHLLHHALLARFWATGNWKVRSLHRRAGQTVGTPGKARADVNETPSEDHRRAWLLDRVDKRCMDTVTSLVSDITDHLAIATSDAVTVRALSGDGASLLPLAAHHPDQRIAASIASVMGQTTEPANRGLWRAVLEEAQPRRWHLPAGHVPADASKKQRAFLEAFPVRAVLAVPVMLGEYVIGGISVLRFGADKEFDVSDQDLVVACATRVAHVLDFRHKVSASPA